MPFWRLGEAIAAFVAMGAELRSTTSDSVFEDADSGASVSEVRYLFNPENGARCPIDSDVADDERLPISVYESWCRRLGMDVPLPPKRP